MNNVRSEYMRERRNLQRKVRSMRARGYKLPEDYIPSIPKKVTQGSIRRIKDLSANAYRNATLTITSETGQVKEVGGSYGRYVERREAGRKAAKTVKTKAPKAAPKATPPSSAPAPARSFSYADAVLGGIEATIDEGMNIYDDETIVGEVYKDQVFGRAIRAKDILNKAISDLGRDTVISNATKNKSIIEKSIEGFIFDSGDVMLSSWTASSYLNDIYRALYGRDLTEDEKKKTSAPVVILQSEGEL